MYSAARHTLRGDRKFTNQFYSLPLHYQPGIHNLISEGSEIECIACTAADGELDRVAAIALESLHEHLFSIEENRVNSHHGTSYSMYLSPQIFSGSAK